MDLASKLDNQAQPTSQAPNGVSRSDRQAKAPKASGVISLGNFPIGGLSMSVLLLSAASFLTGLLLGRGSRRSG
eukprot:Skav217614  [mRNA]  locus=scaffold2172:304128:305324:+ [translate_table: standard]